jgi:putative Holliday junction resolvase
VKRILALDYGQRRIGVALSDPLGLTAQPVGTWPCTGWDGIISKIKALIANKGVEKVIVGFPLTLKGEKGKMAKETERFIQRLRQNMHIPVTRWDERLTSVQAKRSLVHAGKAVRRKKENIDCIAAVLLLQNYLDFQLAGNDKRSEETG